MKGYLLEEAAEAVDAIEADDPAEIRDELGDLLFNVLFLASLYRDRGDFDLDDVATGIADKMVRRHPHVFADGEADWHAIKAAELAAKGRARRSLLDGVPRSQDALDRARILTDRASDVGFDWTDLAGPRAKLDEEIAELDEALASGDPDAIADELGDVLFTVVNLARFLPVDPRSSLQRATDKFGRRFRAVEQAVMDAGGEVSKTDAETLERHWRTAKESE